MYCMLAVCQQIRAEHCGRLTSITSVLISCSANGACRHNLTPIETEQNLVFCKIHVKRRYHLNDYEIIDIARFLQSICYHTALLSYIHILHIFVDFVMFCRIEFVADTLKNLSPTDLTRSGMKIHSVKKYEKKNARKRFFLYETDRVIR